MTTGCGRAAGGPGQGGQCPLDMEEGTDEGGGKVEVPEAEDDG
jgi:hypothetical protein